MLGWSARDLLLLAGTALVVFVPGLLVLVASDAVRRARGPVVVAAAAPLVTAALAYLAGFFCGVLGVRFNLAAVLVVTAVVVAGVVLLRRATGRRTVPAPGPDGDAASGAGGGAAFAVGDEGAAFARDDSAFAPEPMGRPALAVGALAALAAILISLWTWAAGLGRLAVVPQEHDTVTHTLITAYIARTGEAAPGQEWPADLITGVPDRYYPAGLHRLAALIAQLGTDPVTALNAVSVVLFAVAMPLGMLALGTLLRWRGLGAVAGGAAALAAAFAYRPVFAMMHDGGVLSNAAALALVGGAVAALLATGRRPARGVVPGGLLMVGAFAIYPPVAVAIAGGVAAWVVGDALLYRPGARRVRRWALSIGGAALLAALCAVPTLLAAAGSAARTAAIPRDVPTSPSGEPLSSLGQAARLALGMPYGGYLDPAWHRGQVILAVLVLVGVVASIVLRRHAGLLLAWAAWTIFAVLFLTDVGGPVVAAVAGLFYNGYIRISGLVAAYQWLLVGVAVTAVGFTLATFLRPALGRYVRPPALDRAPVLVSAVLVLALTAAAAHYAPVNARALSERYRAPEFTRVDADDRAAFAYLDNHVRPGERVMNNANDGSTYLYVYDGIPVVNIQTLGAEPYTRKLLEDFDHLDTDAQVRELVRKYDIRWVYVDAEEPVIAAATPEDPGQVFLGPPGLEDLADVTSLREVFAAGSVTVYRVKESVFAPATG
ncbi:DUF6541 family protein [Georgenia sp. SYP-B2076]|uniref:DUF6541 family protein n=1 Tax=Georgenia sp. SYP-B2076 TaxID=2495881 RepID=UPI000F8E77B4|nr:DUF6541 family protein [Georgenia sp. SYP-B2076]